MRYLSLEWIDALTEAVARSDTMRDAASTNAIAVTQVVTDTPEGDVTYHLVVGEGVARFGAGAAEPEDVRMVQDYETALGVATGTLNAQEAFFAGRIRLFGDQQKLMANQDVFQALDEVFNDVREHTQYQ